MNQLVLTPSNTLVITGGATGVGVTVHFADWLPSGHLSPGNQLTPLTSGSEAAILAAPIAADSRRLVKSLSVVNASGSSVTVTLGIKTGNVIVPFTIQTLANNVPYSF